FGRPTAITDPNGARYQIDWDLEDRDVRITNPNGATATFEYDAASRLMRVIHFDGRETRVEYDAGDNPVLFVTPDTGTEALSTYTTFGQVATRAASRGPAWEFAYSDKDELIAATSALGTWTMTWTDEGYLRSVESPDRVLSVAYDALGRRSALQDNVALRIEYEWDSRSRLTSMTVNGAFSWRFEYDPRGVITEMRCPGGLLITLAYDLMQRM